MLGGEETARGYENGSYEKLHKLHVGGLMKAKMDSVRTSKGCSWRRKYRRLRVVLHSKLVLGVGKDRASVTPQRNC